MIKYKEPRMVRRDIKIKCDENTRNRIRPWQMDSLTQLTGLGATAISKRYKVYCSFKEVVFVFTL